MRRLRRGAISAYLNAWKAWRVEYFGGALPATVWAAKNTEEAHDAVALLAFTGADQIRDAYLLGGV